MAAERTRKTSVAPTTGRSSPSIPLAASSTSRRRARSTNFYGGYRHGDNLFADCILALDARTGRRLWHFQMVHHDVWDLDNNSAPQLTTIRHGGRRWKSSPSPRRPGYLYVFDRLTGTPIWPIEERPVPQGTNVPVRSCRRRSPFPTNPPPFVRQSFTADDLNPYILTG